MKKLYLCLLVFALLFVGNAFAQEWDYVRIYNSNDPIRPNCMQSLTELESGDIIVNASWRDNYVNGINSENPGLMKFSSDGVLQKEVYWSRFGYRSDDQYNIESPDRQIVPIELSQIQSDVELQHVADHGGAIQNARENASFSEIFSRQKPIFHLNKHLIFNRF